MLFIVTLMANAATTTQRSVGNYWADVNDVVGKLGTIGEYLTPKLALSQLQKQSGVSQIAAGGAMFESGGGFLIRSAAPDGIINWNKSAYSQVTKSIQTMLAGGQKVRMRIKLNL